MGAPLSSVELIAFATAFSRYLPHDSRLYRESAVVFGPGCKLPPECHGMIMDKFDVSLACNHIRSPLCFFARAAGNKLETSEEFFPRVSSSKGRKPRRHCLFRRQARCRSHVEILNAFLLRRI